MADWSHINDPDLDAGVSLDEELEDLPQDVRREAKASESKKHPLDDDKAQRRFRRVWSWWAYERIRQMDNRAERMLAHEFRDHNQWSDDEKFEVEDRGQDPTVFNLVKPALEWISGTERRTRVDYLILPTKPEGAKAAETKTKGFKYVTEVNNSRFSVSQAFDDAITSGLGWIEIGIRSDDADEPIYIGYEDWRNVWHDSHAKMLDLSDARYIFRAKWIDYDIAVAMFPDRKDAIRAALAESDERFAADHDYLDDDLDKWDSGDLDDLDGVYVLPEARRPRVRLVSCEYKVPANVKVIRSTDPDDDLGSLEGTEYDPDNEFMAELVNGGHATIVDAVRMTMRKMIFCGKYVLQDSVRPYNHGMFSLVPIWGYRRKKDGMPYGVVLGMMDPQRDFNKRLSKARWILSSNQVMYQKGAIEDIDEFVDERDRPDGAMEVNDINGVKLRDQLQLAREHVMIMDLCKSMIEYVSGVTPDNRGIPTNAVSGEAIRARQEQGHVMTGPLFDNYLLAFQQAGRIILSLMEQYWTDKKTLRITGIKQQGKPYEFVRINDGLPENDIMANRADFVVSQDAYHASLRQAMFEEFGRLLDKLPPAIAILLLDWWIDLSDLPGKEVAVERIRQYNGQQDPSEDPDDPEVQARRKAEQALQQRRQAIEDKLMQLEIDLKEAQVTKDQAQARKLIADARARLAEIGAKQQDLRIKKADTLHKIEASERAAQTNNIGG